MKLLRNTGAERVIDLVRPLLVPGNQLDVVTSSLSLFAYSEILFELGKLQCTRLLLPSEDADLGLLGSNADRGARNRLQSRWLARRCAAWLGATVELRRASGAVPQGALVARDSAGSPQHAVLGSFSFTTDGLGITPGNPLNLIQASESPEESGLFSRWFDAHWSALETLPDQKAKLIEALYRLAAHLDPMRVYALILFHIFRDRGEDMDEERIVKSATGIRNTVVSVNASGNRAFNASTFPATMSALVVSRSGKGLDDGFTGKELHDVVVFGVDRGRSTTAEA